MKKPLRKWTKKEILNRVKELNPSPVKMEWCINASIQNLHDMLSNSDNPYDVSVAKLLEWNDDTWNSLCNQISEDRASIHYYTNKVTEKIGEFDYAYENEDKDATREALNALVDNILSLKHMVAISHAAKNSAAASFAERVRQFKGDWVNEYVGGNSYDDVEDVLTLYAGGGTHSMTITISDLTKALQNSPDGGHTLVNADISISYDCGIMTLDTCTLELE